MNSGLKKSGGFGMNSVRMSFGDNRILRKPSIHTKQSIKILSPFTKQDGEFGSLGKSFRAPTRASMNQFREVIDDESD